MQNSLLTIIKHIDQPSLIINIKKSVVVGLNNQLREKFKQKVTRGSVVQFKGGIPTNSLISYYTITVNKNSVTLKKCLKKISNTKLIFFADEHCGLLILNSSQDQTLSKSNQFEHYSFSSSSSLLDFDQFHMCYIHNLLCNSRTFSMPGELKDAGIIDIDNSGDAFNWRSIIYKDDLPIYDNMLETCIKEGGNHKISYRIQKKDSSMIHIYDYLGTIKLEDKWPIVSGCIVKKDFPLEIIRQIEQQSLTVRLVGGMIHDFKNLLGGIQNVIEWCITQSQPESNINNALNKTISYTHLTIRLISGILQIIGGKRKPNFVEKIDIGELLLELEELIRHIMSANISFNMDIEPDLPPVIGISSVFQDMLLNLCINARDAMKTKGNKFSIQCYQMRKEQVDGSEKKYIIIKIQDDGCGLTDSQKESMFDAYFSTKKEGSGFGLWMIQESVKTLGGEISVHSEKEKGTVFHIQLNIAENESVERTSCKTEYCHNPLDKIVPFSFKTTKTILFIEDDPLIRSGVFSWLESFGFYVICVENGIEGRDLFMQHKEKIDLIIQDFILPGIRGEDLLIEFIKNRPELPIIVVSAFPDGKDCNWIIDQGAFAFLSKPFKIEQLASLLHKALD